ncbi:MAG: hypothetical protein A3J76_03115 [Candidatus Moranbacteria bacterium RBG_13_45_13]|nr:MAG: hypothetical protein A3J76_03115 [Candidatus Moranbacteria bacterium RBG_13_45_13]
MPAFGKLERISTREAGKKKGGDMKLTEIFQAPNAKAVKNLAQLDEFFEANKDAIVDACTPLELVSGVKVRVATAVVCSRANGDLYLYRRTGEGEPRRGTTSNWDTPKGRVLFTAPGKWKADENQVTGKVIGIGLAHEYQPTGKFQEFVLMPVIVFQANESGEAYLDSIVSEVPPDMGDVKGYKWIPASDITADNAMTKVVAATKYILLN